MEIDPYFERELVSVSANAALCQGRLFVEANGKMRTCNISATLNTGSVWKRWKRFRIQSAAESSVPVILHMEGGKIL